MTNKERFLNLVAHDDNKTINEIIKRVNKRRRVEMFKALIYLTVGISSLLIYLIYLCSNL